MPVIVPIYWNIFNILGWPKIHSNSMYGIGSTQYYVILERLIRFSISVYSSVIRFKTGTNNLLALKLNVLYKIKIYTQKL